MGVSALSADSSEVDYDAVKSSVREILDNDNYDDGSIGPVLIRLAWHASGTYNVADGSGGSGGGATMRFSPEADHGANAGLEHARAFLEPVKAKFPGISYADLWTLAGSVAIEEMGGPSSDCTWRPGRSDAADSKSCTPDGRLPDAAQGAKHLRDIFYRQGFNDQEIVALSGAHTFGRCHTDRSGFDGPWTRAPTTFSNLYFSELVNNTWTIRKWSGPEQYTDPTGDLMMLPTDIALTTDPEFNKWVKVYAEDEDALKKDFGKAWKKLIENGVKFQPENKYQPVIALAALAVATAASRK
jgi:cytochrome c peroxidase